jgi:sec-independent protein translocase protein TatB
VWRFVRKLPLVWSRSRRDKLRFMFGIRAQEAVLVGLLFLVIFGPSKLPGMARDFGRFVSGARRQLDEFKSEITSTEEEEKDNSRREP